jgi:hypothetical protein
MHVRSIITAIALLAPLAIPGSALASFTINHNDTMRDEALAHCISSGGFVVDGRHFSICVETDPSTTGSIGAPEPATVDYVPYGQGDPAGLTLTR